MTGLASSVVGLDGDAAWAAFLAGTLAEFYERATACDDVLVISVPVPRADPLALWGARMGDAAWLWSPPGDGLEMAAIGVTVELRAPGATRFRQMKDAAAAMWQRVGQVAHPACRVRPCARLVGGFAFRSGAASDPAWSRFGDARFVLPRWLYTRSGGDASLSLAVHRQDAAPRARENVVREWAAIRGNLATQSSASTRRGWTIRGVDHVSLAAWKHLVDRARQDIDAGLLRKVVASRRGIVEADAPMDPVGVLDRLRRCNPSSTTFAVEVGATAFLGATPETLVDRCGATVRTEALAGTARVGSGTAPGAILRSGKDRHEHGLVVREIVERLKPSCLEVVAPTEPEPRCFGDIVHLRTPIEGALRNRDHVLDLVERLHPTPAVGGLPREAALQWLEAREPCSRGWYAGPVGWFDARGDGTFVVALRSGLLRERRAWVYAGAGLVRGSDPTSEYNETGWKLQVMCQAIRDAGAREGG